MASIYKRKNQDGTSCWRAVIRIKGHPTVCGHFERKQEADDWAADVERQIRSGHFKIERHKSQRSFTDLFEHYIESGSLEHRKSARDTLRHLIYWKERFKSYALVHITPELLTKERRLLLETSTEKGKPRKNATVNRYFAALSAIFTYACRKLRWVNENPCSNLIHLKEAPGRDRVLTEEECVRLLSACRESRSPYLYCIVLISMTTGCRRSEVLGLAWKSIDWQNQLAHFKNTKNGRPRSVPLVAPVIEELQKLYKERDPNKELVFASRTAFGQIDINKVWYEALKKAQLTNNVVFHTLRHTFITWSARTGSSTLELKAASGHLTMSALLNYTHLEGQMTRKFSENILNRVLEGQSFK